MLIRVSVSRTQANLGHEASQKHTMPREPAPNRQILHRNSLLYKKLAPPWKSGPFRAA